MNKYDLRKARKTGVSFTVSRKTSLTGFTAVLHQFYGSFTGQFYGRQLVLQSHTPFIGCETVKLVDPVGRRID